MGGKYEVTTKCDDAPEEEPTVSHEDFNDLKCNIQGDTNHLREGIKLGLEDKIEKTSPTLGVNANYTRVQRIARLPRYLPVHLVRFFWRKDTQKKAKILRKVTFQHEIDLLEFCTDDLRKKLIPIRDKIREIRKDEVDAERAKKRQKRIKLEQEQAEDSNVRFDEPLQKRKEKEAEREAKAAGPDSEAELAAKKKDAGATQDADMTGTETYKTDEELDRERAEAILCEERAAIPGAR